MMGLLRKAPSNFYGMKEVSNMPVPSDPMILLSFVNTKLRDFHPSLEDLCKSLQLDPQEITRKLSGIGYEYDAQLNRFV